MHGSQGSEIDAVSPEGLKRWLADGGVVVDIRAPRQFVDGHIPGSVSLPLCRRWAEWCGALLPTDRPLMLVADCEAEIEAACRLVGGVGGVSFAGRLDAGCSPGTPMDAWVCGGGAIDELPTMGIRAVRALLLGDDGDGGVPAIVDVRDARERAMLGCGVSVHVPLGMISEVIGDFPNGRPVLTLCRSGVRSVIAASVLRRHGFVDVMPIELGVDRWWGEYPGDPWWEMGGA